MCVGAKMQRGRQAATGSTKCLLACRPACSCGIAMDADDGAFQHGHLPTSLRCQGAQATQDAAPDAGCRPALETPPCRAPVHQLGRRIPPSSVSRPLRGEPVRAGQSMASTKRGWSMEGRPVLGFCGGSKGKSRFHITSVTRARIFTQPRCDHVSSSLALATEPSAKDRAVGRAGTRRGAVCGPTLAMSAKALARPLPSVITTELVPSNLKPDPSKKGCWRS